MDEQGVPLNKHNLFIFQGVGSIPIFHVKDQLFEKEGLQMFATFISLFTFVILAMFLGLFFFLAYQNTQNERVQVPVKSETSKIYRNRRV